MHLSNLRHAAGRAIRNFRRDPISGVGHDFVADVRARLPHVELRVIFDVGAHIGMTAIEYSDEFPNAVIYAFEPHPCNFARMKSNLVGKPDVKLYNIGLGADPGELPFHFDPEHPSTARIVAHGEAVTDIITIDTVDCFCAKHAIAHIDFMKVDVEGHEIEVLKGAKKVLANDPISILRIESAIDPDMHYHTQLWHLCDFLQPLGYRIFGFYDQWENTLSTESAKLRRFDVVFVSPGAQKRDSFQGGSLA